MIKFFSKNLNPIIAFFGQYLFNKMTEQLFLKKLRILKPSGSKIIDSFGSRLSNTIMPSIGKTIFLVTFIILAVVVDQLVE